MNYMIKLDYLDNIYYINLDSDTNKNYFFLKQIKDSILHNICERYSGVDGSYIDIRLLPEKLITDTAKLDILSKKQKTYGVSLTYGSLGCALSHMLIYKEVSKFKNPVLILEDDILLCDNFDTKLKILIDQIRNMSYDLCYIGYNQIAGFKKTKINDVIAKPSGLITGTYGYFLTPYGAQKILSTIFPLNVQIDSSISNNCDKLNILCSSDTLVSATNEFRSKTQQDVSCKNVYRKENKDSWYSLFIK